MSTFDPINQSLNIVDSSLEDCEKIEKKDVINDFKDNEVSILKDESKIDVKKDYEYTRANLYSLIEKGQEAINGILELAEEGSSPRAYEVAGQLIKNIGDVTDKLVDLQKKMKELDEDKTSRSPNSVTNNAVFIGSTSELLKTLKKDFLNNIEGK